MGSLGLNARTGVAAPRSAMNVLAAMIASLINLHNHNYNHGVRGCAHCVRVALVNKSFKIFTLFQFFIRNSYILHVNLLRPHIMLHVCTPAGIGYMYAYAVCILI